MPATFYILYSDSIDTYYIGHCTEPMEERLRKHNSIYKGSTGGASDLRIILHPPQFRYVHISKNRPNRETFRLSTYGSTQAGRQFESNSRLPVENIDDPDIKFPVSSF